MPLDTERSQKNVDVRHDTKMKRNKNEKNIPLFQRLTQERAIGNDSEEDEHENHSAPRKGNKRKMTDRSSGENDRTNVKMGRAHKNAPAEMASNRPVRRLRVDADNSSKKCIDPRFNDISGKLDENTFSKNFDFLDGYKEDEIQKMSGVLKKVKAVAKRDEIKVELLKMKQQLNERKRGLKVAGRLEEMKREERAKVKEGNSNG